MKLCDTQRTLHLCVRKELHLEILALLGRVTTNADGNQEYILSEDTYNNVLKMAIQYDIMRRRFEFMK